MAVGSIKFKITADIKELKAAMSEAGRVVNDTASKVKKSGGLFSGIKNGLKGIGSAAVSAVGRVAQIATSITIFKAVNSTLETIGSSVQSAFNRADVMMTFERAMTRVTGSAEEAKKVLEATNAVVKGTPYGLDVASKAVQGFANSNLGVKNSVQYVSSWADAVAAYGDGSNDTLQRVTFQLQQMAAKGKVNLEDLNSAMEAGIPVLQIFAEASGMSLDEVRENISAGSVSAADFMAVMDEAFTSGTASFKGIAGEAKNAGNTWQGTFDNMRAATTRGVLGIIESIDEGLVANGLPTIKEAVKKYGEILESGMGALETKIKPAISKVTKVIKDAWPVIEKVFNSIKGIAETTGDALLKAFGEMSGPAGDALGDLADFITRNMETIESVITTSIEVVTGIFLGLKDTFDIVLPVVQEFIDWVKEISPAFAAMIPEGKSVTDIVRDLTPIIVGCIAAFKLLKGAIALTSGAITVFKTAMTISATMSTFSAAVGGSARAMHKLPVALKIAAGGVKLFVTFMKGIGTVLLGAFKAIGAAVMAHPVIAAIAIIVGILLLLWFKCEWFRDGVKAIWKAIADAFQAGVEKAGQWLSDMGDKISAGWERAKEAFSSAGEAIGDAFNKMVEWFKKMGSAAKDMWDGMVSAFKTGAEFIGNVITVAFMLVYNIIEGALTLVVAYITSVWQWIAYFTKIIWTDVSDFLKDVWQGIVDFYGPALKILWEMIKSAWESVSDATKAVWNAIVDFLKAMWSGISNIASTVFNAIATFFSNIWNKIKEVSSAVWTVIYDFMVQIWNKISTAVGAALEIVANIVKAAWEVIKTVTSVVWNVIKTLIDNFWNDIKIVVTAAINVVKAVITTVWNAIKAVTSAVWDGIKAVISTVWDGIKSGVTTAVNAVKSVVSNVWGSIKGTTSTVWNGIKDTISGAINGAKDIVKNAIDKIKGFFTGLSLKFPSIQMPKLPHFSLTGSFSLKPPSVPKLGVSWYATGGIATGPSVVGIGESGDEAILPLSNKSRMAPFANAVASMINSNDSGIGNNNGSGKSDVVVTGNTFIVRKEDDVRKIGKYIVTEADRIDRAKGKDTE